MVMSPAEPSSTGTSLVTRVDSLLPRSCGPRTELEHWLGRARTGAAQMLCRVFP